MSPDYQYVELSPELGWPADGEMAPGIASAADGGIPAGHQPDGKITEQSAQGHVRRPAQGGVEVVVEADDQPRAVLQQHAGVALRVG